MLTKRWSPNEIIPTEFRKKIKHVLKNLNDLLERSPIGNLKY